MYHFSMLRVFNSVSLFRVLASCPVSEEHSQEWQKKKEILGRGYDSRLETWIRTPDGRIDQEIVSKRTPGSISPNISKVRLGRLSKGHGNAIILGMSYSALKYNYQG